MTLVTGSKDGLKAMIADSSISIKNLLCCGLAGFCETKIYTTQYPLVTDGRG
ncbi:MAG: hypothetical protein ACSNEK_06220 [Parachlamydiaceae bacterium]